MSQIRFIICLLLSVLFAGVADAREPCKTIRDVRFMNPEEAAQGFPVEMESQIVWVDQLRGSFFINDGQFGTYVRTRLENQGPSALRPGDVVRIHGVTGKGSFAPEIVLDKLEVVGRKPLPEARPFWHAHLHSATVDCDWLSLHGRLIAYEVLEESRTIVVEMMRNERVLYIQVPLTEENEKRVSELMFHTVKFNAVAGTVNNSNRQSVGRIFYVSSAADFEIEALSESPAAGAEEKAIPIHELMRLGMNHLSITKTFGTVTHAGEREIFLRGEKAALSVSMQQPPDFEIGDVVEVVGLVWPLEVSPSFRAYSAEVIRKEAPPVPVRIKTPSEIYDALNFDLIQIDAQLVEIGRSFGLIEGDNAPNKEVKLLCRAEDRLFEVQLPAGTELPESVGVGAKIRLTGLCHVLRENWRPWYLDVNGFWLQLRSAADVEVLVPAPWWTTARLLGLLGITASALLLFLVWVFSLRKTIERQTGIIAEKVEREAVLDERQRIARELHDNLEQGLAGAIFQLGGCQRLQEMGTEKSSRLVRQLLESELPACLKTQVGNLGEELSKDANQRKEALGLVEEILRHCSEESRSSILDLRGGLLEKMDLVSAVNMTLHQLADERRGVELEARVEGTPDRLKQNVERNLLLVIKEAAFNAVRHASASRITVELNFTNGLVVTVSDDGCGFDMSGEAALGHFGLQGMQERMKQVGGILSIESTVGSGTVITATLAKTEHSGGR